MTTLEALLEKQNRQQLTRTRIMIDKVEGPISDHDKRHYTCFNRNDYLGLSQHPEVKRAAISAIDRYGTSCSASQLVAGYFHIHQALEETLADFLHQPRAIIFPSGSMANYALMACLAKTNPDFIADKMIHASIIDGININESKLRRFPHNNYHIQEKWLQRSSQSTHVITEGVFSAEGDLSPLPEMIKIAKRYNANLVIDDSHGIGVIGAYGSVSYHQVDSGDITAITGSFGKSLGSQGGFIAGSDALIEVICQMARPFIFTTSLAPASAAAALAALNLIKNEPEHQEKLLRNIDHFHRKANHFNITHPANPSAIQHIVIPDIPQLIKVHTKLKEHGFLVGMFRPPSVPKGQSRLRITLSANHTHTQIDLLLEIISHAMSDSGQTKEGAG